MSEIPVCMAVLSGSFSDGTITFEISTGSSSATTRTLHCSLLSYYLSYSCLIAYSYLFITAEDYELTKTTLRLMPGNVRRDCVLITIIDDDESEGVESFTVTATLVQSTIRTNMITIAPTEARVLINDNDGTNFESVII